MLNKKFWKYFFNTYKNARWLVLRYIIVAVYLTVSSIFTNKMELGNLTYFNAIITITYFCELLAFGISNGMSVYINQNIKDKDKSAHYVKVGFYLNCIIAGLVIVLLVILKKPILHGLMGFSDGIDYLFYYLMLIYIFFDCILHYITHILKALKVFVAQMLNSLIQCALLVIGFMLLYFTSGLALNYIAIIYITTMVACIIAGLVSLKRNKLLSINIFTKTKFRLSKKEISVLLHMTGMEVVWQVGYTLISLFLLKVSEVAFNQYAYLENVLNVFNGLLFSFIILTSIEICRSLGREQYDEAYIHGKYSLYATLIIWFVYLVVSLALLIPIRSGMHIELQSTAFVAILLYVFTHLFRFLVWNLGSYILCWGGKVKILFWIETCSTIYIILIYCLANFIPNNLYLIYLLVALDSIIKLPILLWLFKRKKWLKNVSLDK
jgi:Na+-driven multidrug efflux pump